MASVGFRWLDILEKEFDKAFVDLDLAIGELDSEEPDVVYSVRQKLCSLSSCFAQLTHKAQTIFQNSAKIEAELIHIRAELVESKSKREILEQELHNLLLQLHSSQLTQLPNNLNNGNFKQDAVNFKPEINSIKKKLEEELLNKRSPTHPLTNMKEKEELKFSSALLEGAQLRNECVQLRIENGSLRNSILALTSEVYGAKLAAKYLDKELAGRIQQLQLLGREMRGDVRDKLWRQLESEILLQRHKTVVRECRRNSVANCGSVKPEMPSLNENGENFGDIRTVVVKRKPGQGLGISITGGREHGVPILISELEPNGPAAVSGQLYIGDAILSVNDRDLRQACHREAVDILKQHSEECRLQVQYIAADDSDNSLEEDGYNFRYRFFDAEVCGPNDCVNLQQPLASSVKTPTAPRTPDSSSPSGITLTNNASPETDGDFFAIDRVLDQLQSADISNCNNDPDLISFKKASNTDLNCSTNSLNSENLSSPMQTSTDVFVDSEILSTDSQQSPKNAEPEPETFSNTNSSCDSSSPVHSNNNNNNNNKKVQRKHKTKKYFGVKTLQSIFSGGRADRYSDISSTASDEIPPQFEENIHQILSEMFGQKKAKCLKMGESSANNNEQKREKLLARYVYNANVMGVDGVGDPDFGTPV